MLLLVSYKDFDIVVSYRNINSFVIFNILFYHIGIDI